MEVVKRNKLTFLIKESLTACRAQIRVGGGKDGSRKTNLEATAYRLHSPL